METINTIELGNPDVLPDDRVLQAVLGDSHNAYIQLLNMFSEKGMTHEWKYYRDGKAWLCKVQLKKRTIVWMSAWKGFMQATLYFPQKYQEQVLASDIRPEFLKKFIHTNPVGRSMPFIFEIRETSMLREIEKAVDLKVQCR